MTNSNDLTKSVLSILRMRGAFCWRQNNAAVFDPKRKIWRSNSSTKGVPDIIGLTKQGQFIGIEIKSRNDRVSKDQEIFLAEIRKRGGIGAVVRNAADILALMDIIS